MTNSLRVLYQTMVIGGLDIHLCTLRNKQQYSDPHNAAADLGISSAAWPIFGVVWPSSLVLAHHLLTLNSKGKRILEVGCGIGLSSLLLNEQYADITATDYHPEVEAFLDRNTALNNRRKITFERADWGDNQSQMGLFDLIIGSDVLYEDEHVNALAQFMQAHANKTCEIIIVDPDRGRKNKLSLKMSAYGFTSNHIRPENTVAYLEEKYKGHILRFSRAELM